MHEFYKDNKQYCICLAVIVLCCLVGAWLVYDEARNEHLQINTGHTMADINQRIDSAGNRIESAAAGISEAEKAVGSAAAGIAKSERAAAEISNGIEQCQAILDGCIQRAGRIKNIIADVEAINRQGTADAPAADLAK